MSNAESTAKLIAEGRIEEALKQADVGEGDLLLKTGILFSKKGHYYTAEKILDRVTQLDPKSVMAWYHKGNVFYGLKRYRDAIKCYDKTLGINPKDANAWYSKGLALERSGRYEKGIECFNKTLRIDSKYVYAWYAKGLACNYLERYEKAIECFDKVLELNPGYVDALNNKGLALEHLERHKEAIEFYNRALESNPEHVEAWHNKGITLGRLGRHEEAIECFDKVIKLNRRHAYAWYNKGTALYLLKRHEEAIECFDKALEINPKDVNVWCNKGVALEDREKYEEAIKCFGVAAALEIKPNVSGRAYQNLISLLDKLAISGKLEENYEIIKSLDPKILQLLYQRNLSACENTPLEKIQEIAREHPENIGLRMNLLGKLSLLEKYDKAIDEARKIVSDFPENKFSHFTLGSTLIGYIATHRILNPYKRHSLIKEAERELKNIIEIDPNFALAHLYLAVLYSYADHEDKAEKEFEEAFNLEPQYIRFVLKFLEELGEKYGGKYDHKDIIPKIIQVIKTTGKIAFIGAIGTGLALGGTTGGAKDKIPPPGDDLTTIDHFATQPSLTGNKEVFVGGLHKHPIPISQSELDMIKNTDRKLPLTVPPKKFSEGTYSHVSMSFEQEESKQISEIINGSISKTVEQYIIDKKPEKQKEIKNLGTRGIEDKWLKDAFGLLDTAAIPAIIAYFFYRKSKKDQQKMCEKIEGKVEEIKKQIGQTEDKTNLLRADEKNELSSTFISNTINVLSKLDEVAFVKFLGEIQKVPNAMSYLEIMKKEFKKVSEAKYELANVYETLARIHLRLGNIRDAMGNIDQAATLYLEIGSMGNYSRIIKMI